MQKCSFGSFFYDLVIQSVSLVYSRCRAGVFLVVQDYSKVYSL